MFLSSLHSLYSLPSLSNAEFRHLQFVKEIFRDSPNSFDGQEKDEIVLLLLRRHVFTILVPLALFILACLLPIITGVMFYSYLSAQGLVNLFFFVSSIWYLGIWLAIFYALTIYTLDTVIITDHRIIDNDQRGLFYRNVSELHSHRIQDVSTRTNGVIETFLNFGDVTVQTAGSEKQFVFHQMPEPVKVKDIIMQTAATRDSGVKAL